MNQQLINSLRVNSKYDAVTRPSQRASLTHPAEKERERERESEHNCWQAPTRKINYVISESRDSPAGLRGTFYWNPSSWAPGRSKGKYTAVKISCPLSIQCSSRRRITDESVAKDRIAKYSDSVAIREETYKRVQIPPPPPFYLFIYLFFLF